MASIWRTYSIQPFEPFNRPGHFLFTSLPAELRLQIYYLLLPHHITIEFEPQMCYYIHHRRCTSPIPALLDCVQVNPPPSKLNICTSLLLINRFLREEAYGVLYGSNTFRFFLTRIDHGLWNTPAYTNLNTILLLSTYVTRRIQRCQIIVRLLVKSALEYRRAQRYLKDVVKKFGSEHRLKHLQVHLECGIYTRWVQQNMDRSGQRIVGQFKRENDAQWTQYCLEPMAELRNIEKVQILGDVEGSFAEKLSRVMVRKAGSPNMKKVVYGRSTIKRKKPGRLKKSTSERSDKKFWFPELDWEELVSGEEIADQNMQDYIPLSSNADLLN